MLFRSPRTQSPLTLNLVPIRECWSVLSLVKEPRSGGDLRDIRN